MAFPRPEYSRNQVDKAGKILVDRKASIADLEWALAVLTNWRGCHGYPINTFQSTLRSRLSRIGGSHLIAQRLKRAPSIVAKLDRFETMKLSRMQDIGGLRAVLPNIKNVRSLEQLYLGSKLEHEIESHKDYITAPKDDGYRGVHLVFKYSNAKAPEYNGLRVELQIRTRVQHAWATAVETMGIFLGQALKSREGDKAYLDFFALAGAGLARYEKSPPVPGYEKYKLSKLILEINRQEKKLQVLDRLRGFSAAAQVIHNSDRTSAYNLIVLDAKKRRTDVMGFSKDRLGDAMKAYEDLEKRVIEGEKLETVLVSAGSIENLKRAFPNYFLDTHVFIDFIDTLIDLE